MAFYPLGNHTQMADMTPADQAQKAIRYVLTRVRRNDRIGNLMGPGTESFDLLTEALSSLAGLPVEEVRAHFQPMYVKEG